MQSKPNAVDTMDQKIIQSAIQTHALDFMKMLPNHAAEFEKLLQECTDPVNALVNKAEQVRHVEKADVPHLEQFRATQDNLLYYIFRGIEEELLIIKTSISRMTRLNQDLKNKLSALENSTLNIDWEDTSELITGTALQPPLKVLLSGGFDFYTFFHSIATNINERFNDIDLRNEKLMSKFKDAFNIDFNCKTVRYFLAITQYASS